MNTAYKSQIDDCPKIEIDTKKLVTGDLTELNDDQHAKLLDYLTKRLDKGQTRRTNRMSRYASIDQKITTWQKLSPEDSKRLQVEDSTGKSQALPMNMPIVQAHLDDTVAFFSEVFAPLGGNFYAIPGGKAKTPQIEALAGMMNQDTKINSYFAHVAMTMRQLCKYNIGGFEVYWKVGSSKSVGQETMDGNVVESIDMYNISWDESIDDVGQLSKEGEWAARFMLRNRKWLVQQALDGKIINAEKVLGSTPDYDSSKVVGWADNTENLPYNAAKYYRNPPGQTKMDIDGKDEPTSAEQDASKAVDWDSFGLGLNVDSYIGIDGYEVTRMYCFINPKQFQLAEDDGLVLYRFLIVDAKTIILAEQVQDADSIPMYLGRVNQDNMREAMRSVGEYLVPFQRFISFLLNTHVAGVRGSVWGMKAYDPTVFDMSGFQKGEVAGLIPSKIGGRDVRSAIAEIRTQLDTRANVEDAASVREFMKDLFPNQALPGQIASMDRAVSSQVSAVLQGAMRKMHMLARVMDAILMLPTRQQQYKNISTYGKSEDIKGITEKDVADLLSSGLGQLNREAAAAQLHDIIFALIQNQEAMAIFDIPGLFRQWSLLTNTGVDLGDYVKQAPQTQVPVNPDGTAPTADGSIASPAAPPNGVAVQ